LSMGIKPKWYEFSGNLRPMARSLGIGVPPEVSGAIGRIGQVRVRIRVNGTEADTLMLTGPNASHFLKLSAGFRKEAGIQANQNLTVQLMLAENEPDFVPPADLKTALEAHALAKARWDLLPYRHKKGHVRYISEAARPEARARRVSRIVEALSL